MNTTDFESSLAGDGFDEVLQREMRPGTDIAEHDHPFDARGLIVSGELTLTVDGVAQTYRPGEVFDMAAGCRHRETSGPQGVQFVVGRRHPA